MRRLFALLPMLAGLSASALGQQSPFLTEDTYNKLTNEISGDVAYDNLRSLVMYHAPSGESQGFVDEAQWVEVDEVERLDTTDGLIDMIRRAVAVAEGRLR